MTLSCNLNFGGGGWVNDEAQEDADVCRECTRTGKLIFISPSFLMNSPSKSLIWRWKRFDAKLQEVNALLLRNKKLRVQKQKQQ